MARHIRKFEIEMTNFRKFRRSIAFNMGIKVDHGEDESDRIGMNSIYSKLYAADKMELWREGSAGIWMEKLQDLTSDLDDFFVLHYEVLSGQDFTLKLQELNNRLTEFFVEARSINFPRISRCENFRIPRTLHVDESEVRGRENDKKIIVKELLSTRGNDKVGIIGIVGMAGIGKTTLAQSVYNDERVKNHFELIKWTCVSNAFDDVAILKEILEYPEMSHQGLHISLQRLKVLISRKKFLLVLDDMHLHMSHLWGRIWDAFQDGNAGSRILVTMRSELLARDIGTHYVHTLNPLSDFDCWSILSGISFLGRSIEGFEKLEEIEFKISRKCMGLPLAAKVLGGLLRSKDTVEQWQSILQSEVWELEEMVTHVFATIYLSYKELAPNWQDCFLHCVVFPEDFLIDVEQLIRLWMAQGYIDNWKYNETLESEGYFCFKMLVERSFFYNLERDPYDKDRIIKCKMHGVYYAFARHLLKNECLTIKTLDEAKNVSSKKVCHLTWLANDVSASFVTKVFEKFKSFFSFSCINIDSNLFSCLKGVRALSLHDAWLDEVPRAIGKLIHLRYLDLRRNNYLNEFPEEICNLYNLETLDITDCPKFTRLPQRIGDLKNLRSLLNSGTNIKNGVEKLTTSLRVLKELKVGEEYNKFKCLRNLNHLGGEISIEFFGKVNEANFDKARLGDKTDIHGLILLFYGSGVQVSELPPNLKRLSVYFYPYSTLPTCVMSRNNLKVLNISFGNVSSLNGLWKLPSLEILQLFVLQDIKVLDHEFLGTTENSVGHSVFPKLKKLKFSRLQNLRSWEDLGERNESVISNIMPCLRELDLYECHELKMLPHHLLRKASMLEILSLRSCTTLTKRYNRSADSWSHVSHIPNVLIDGSRQAPLV